MRQKLESLNSFHTEGIFRLAGDVMDVQLLKDCANDAGTLSDGKVNDVHAWASLLKVFFHDFSFDNIRLLINFVIIDLVSRITFSIVEQRSFRYD